MQNIPKPAIFLTIAGILPFLWGVSTIRNSELYQWSINVFGPNLSGINIMIFYGAIILAFMSGVLWGFSTNMIGHLAYIGYFLSIIPVVWVLFLIIPKPEVAVQNLLIGFVFILFFDWYFWRHKAAPDWWMGLRASISALVVICLLLGKN